MAQNEQFTSSAAVPGAAVTLTDTATGIPLTQTTNTAGLYVFQDVNVGTYELTVEKQGFRKSIVTNQIVSTGTNLTLNVTLAASALMRRLFEMATRWV